MSTREKAIDIINGMTEEQLQRTIGILTAISEHDDDIYCKNLLEEYLNDGDNSKHETITLDQLATELGIDLD